MREKQTRYDSFYLFKRIASTKNGRQGKYSKNKEAPQKHIQRIASKMEPRFYRKSVFSGYHLITKKDTVNQAPYYKCHLGSMP